MKIRTSGGTGAIINNNVAVNNNVEVTSDNIVKANPAQDVPTRGSVRKVPTSSIITETVNKQPKVAQEPIVNKTPIVKEEPKEEIPEAVNQYANYYAKEIVQQNEVRREPAKSPISFGEKIENPLNNKRSYVFEIEQALKTIKECFEMIQIDQVKDDTATKIIHTMTDIVGDPEIIIDNAMNELDDYTKVELSATYLDMNIDNLSDEERLKFLKTSDINSFMDRYVDVRCSAGYDESNNYVMHLDVVSPNAELEDAIVYKSVDVDIEYNPEQMSVATSGPEIVTENNEDLLLNKSDAASATYYAADIINISTIDANAQATDVIVIDDNQGGYLHDADGSLIVIDRIQEKDVSEVSVVSKVWLEGVIRETEVEEEKTVMSEALKNINLKE